MVSQGLSSFGEPVVFIDGSDKTTEKGRSKGVFTLSSLPEAFGERLENVIEGHYLTVPNDSVGASIRSGDLVYRDGERFKVRTASPNDTSVSLEISRG